MCHKLEQSIKELHRNLGDETLSDNLLASQIDICASLLSFVGLMVRG